MASNLLLTLLVLSLCMVGAKSCNTQPAIVYQKLDPTEKSIQITLIIPGCVSPPHQPRFNGHVQISRQNGSTISQNCKNMVPGLHHLAVGIRDRYVSMNRTDIPYPLARFLLFTCSESKIIKRRNESEAKLIPDQLEDFREQTNSHYDQYTKIFSAYSELLETFDFRLRHFWNTYIRNAKSIFTSQRTRVTTYGRTEYEAPMSLHSMKESLQPEFEIAYKTLPNQYEGNEFKYAKFIERYGNKFYLSSRMGGIIHIVVAYSSRGIDSSQMAEFGTNTALSLSMMNVISEMIKRTTTTVDSHYVMSDGGDLRMNKSLDDWSESLFDLSVPIGGETLTFDNLFEDDQRAASFRLAVQHEQTTQDLKLIKVHLQNMDKGKIRHQLLKLVERELGTVTPRHEVANSLMRVINSDFGLEDQYLKGLCPQIQDVSGYYWKLFAFEGVCVTLDGPTYHCGSVNLEMIPKPFCVQMYEKANCVGEPVIARTAAKMHGWLLQKYNSWIICREIVS